MPEVKDPRRGRPNSLKVVARAIAGLWHGFIMVLRHLGRRPITEQYPEYKRLPAGAGPGPDHPHPGPGRRGALRGLLSLFRRSAR